MTLDEKLADLLKQATEERSHYYVASVIKEAIADRERLKFDPLQDLNQNNRELKSYVDLYKKLHKEATDLLRAINAYQNRQDISDLLAAHKALVGK